MALVSNGGPAVGNNGAFDYFVSQPIALGGGTKVDFVYDDDPKLTNAIEYTSNPAANVSLGQIFNLGYFTFTNGLWFPQADIGFTLTTHSSDVLFNNHTFSGTLEMRSVSDSGNPVSEADFIYVIGKDGLALGSCRVYDLGFQPASNPGNVGLCGIAGKIDSLVLTNWVAQSDAAFVNSSVTDELAPAATAVPEPATMVLTGIGLAFAAARRCRRR